jgi:Flp pilus assembly protein TadG
MTRKARMGQRPHSSQRGIATTEFAIVLPVLLLMLFGVTELGRALVRYNALTKAVHDGARFAATYALLGTTGNVNVDTQLITEVRNVVVYGNSAGAGTPVIAGLTTGQIQVVDAGGDEVRVEAAYPYTPIMGTAIPNFGLGSAISTSFVMQAAVTMRAL